MTCSRRSQYPSCAGTTPSVVNGRLIHSGSRRRGSQMKRLLGLLALAGLVALATPVAPAEAASLITPGAAAQTEGIANDLVIDVRHGGGGFHGGGHFGGARFGGARFGGGHFGRAHFGGARFVHRPYFVGHRFAHRRAFIVRRHFYRPYAYYPVRPVVCRWVLTDFGPRRVCRYRPWWWA